MSGFFKFIGGVVQIAAATQILGHAVYYEVSRSLNVDQMVVNIGLLMAGAALSRAGKWYEESALKKQYPTPPEIGAVGFAGAGRDQPFDDHVPTIHGHPDQL